MKRAIYHKETGTVEYVELTQEEIDELNNMQPSTEEQISELKQQLTDTDYKAIKYAEGLLTEEEYAETKAQRQEWRARINELESEMS